MSTERPRVAIFAPSLVLTVTVEDHESGPDLHVHAGGQGLWQARMLESLGFDTIIATALIGEVGRILRHLVEDEEHVELLAIERSGRGAAYVHDRRGGERVPLVETGGDPLDRHDIDELYGLALRAALEADATILAGPAGEGILPDDTYRRLAADLRAAGRPVVADLAGSRLDAVLEAGVDLLKVSDEELVDDGLATSGDDAEVLAAIARLRGRGAEHVIVTRSDSTTLAAGPDGMLEASVPALQIVDTRGAGDSLTAGAVSVLARGGSLEDALRLGVAAGAVNVTRHGLGSADPEAIRAMERLVEVRRIDGKGPDG